MTDEDIAALVALSKYRRLTSAQLQRVAYDSRSTAERRLRLLTKAGYLQRLQAPAAHRGTRPFVYSLTVQGLEALADILGEPRGQGGSASPPARKLDGHVLHYLAVNDFWIRLEEEVRALASLRLVGFVPYHQREKKPWGRKAIPVVQDRASAAEKEKQALLLEPDAAFCLDDHGTKLLMLVEIDRTGTISGVGKHSFADKIQNYISYLYSGIFRILYRRLFLTKIDEDFTSFCVLTVTTTETKMEGMLSVIPQEFEFRGKMFFFSTFQRLERGGILGSEWLDGSGRWMVFQERFLIP